MKKNQFVLAVYVDNQFGVLTRVTSMFTRRGFNIDALTVGETERPEYSRITISLSGDGYAREQMLNQLRKLVNVKKVEIIPEDNAVKRELSLIKLRNTSEHRSEIMVAVEVYRAKIIDYGSESLCIEITGEPSKIDAFIRTVMPYGIIEMCRTGEVALERGSASILEHD